MKKHTLEQQMTRLGIPESEHGPYVTELRKKMQKKLDNGMSYQSAGTWTPGTREKMSYEEIAKHYLSWEWAIEHRYCYKVSRVEPPHFWKYELSDNGAKKVLNFNLKEYFLFFVVGAIKKHFTKSRIWFDKNILGIRNPYL